MDAARPRAGRLNKAVQQAPDRCAPSKGDEAGRIAAVRRYDILDTPPDGAFDRITALAARIFDVPMAVVSIVDVDRIWFKSHHGFEATEISRDPGLCASAILDDRPWIASDTTLDPRTLANPLVAGDFGLRFYAGAPLLTWDGFSLGTLAVMARAPRQVSPSEEQTLTDLASVVVDQLELSLSARRMLALGAELQAQTQLKSELAEQAARTDPLTGLRNRRALDADLTARAELAYTEGTDVAVVMIDVDGLKAVNDRLGHSQGDALLQSFAEALQAAFRASDVLYRVGGDEFTIAIPVKEDRDLRLIAERVEAALSRVRGDGWPTMGASSGVALLSEAGWSRGEALALADARMYERKLSAAGPAVDIRDRSPG